MELAHTRIGKRSFENEDNSIDESDPPMIYTGVELGPTMSTPRLPQNSVMSSSSLYHNNPVFSDTDIFVAKTIRFEKAEATFQSISDADRDYAQHHNHPFIDSLRSVGYSGANVNDRPEQNPINLEDHQAYRKEPSNRIGSKQGMQKIAENSKKCDDFMYEDDNWDVIISNRLNQIINQNDEKVMNFIETNQIFKKNTDHEVQEYRQPDEMYIIEMDNNNTSLFSSNRLSDKGSMDVRPKDKIPNRAITRGAISNTDTPGKYTKPEAQYFSFNARD